MMSNTISNRSYCIYGPSGFGKSIGGMYLTALSGTLYGSDSTSATIDDAMFMLSNVIGNEGLFVYGTTGNGIFAGIYTQYGGNHQSYKGWLLATII